MEIPSLWDRAALKACGYDDRWVDRALRYRRLVPVRHGLHCHPDAFAACSQDERFGLAVSAALRAVGGGAVAACESAARLHGLVRLGPWSAKIELARAGGGSFRGPGLVVRDIDLPARHVTSAHGLAVTTIARTAVDLARSLPMRSGVVTADAALQRGCSSAALAEAAAHSRDWPGALVAQQVVALADAKAESPLETLGRLAVIDAGLPRPRTQYAVRTAGGTYFLDMLLKAWQVALEADGAVKYVGGPAETPRPDRLLSEKERQEHLEDAGIAIVRFGWSEAFHRPERIGARTWAAVVRQCDRYGWRLPDHVPPGVLRRVVRGRQDGVADGVA